MTKGAIFYTDFHLDPLILKVCQEQLKKSFDGEIVSVSLKKPLDLGKNIVISGRERSYPTYILQILTALEVSIADYVFFTEHDVIYNPTHFDFIPPRDDTFYYNTNFFRWRYPENIAITWNKMCSLSAMCCNRKFAVEHYRKRMQHIKEQNMDEFRSREPRFARLWGYEPGTKRTRRGGFSNDLHDFWQSEFSLVDIRHDKTFSRPKTRVEEFKHPPDMSLWIETKIPDISGYDWKYILNQLNVHYD